MKPFPVLIAALIALPTTATADACLEEFRAFFDANFEANAMAPFRMREQTYAQDDTPLRSMVVEVTSSVDLMSMSPGAPLYLQRGAVLYTATDRAGPWTKATELPADPEGAYRQQHLDRVANLRDVTCHGEVTHNGAAYLAYSWTTQTSPTAEGHYFGETTSGYFDPGTGRPVVTVISGVFGHWAPEPSTEKLHRTYEYDPALVLPVPE